MLTNNTDDNTKECQGMKKICREKKREIERKFQNKEMRAFYQDVKKMGRRC